MGKGKGGVKEGRDSPNNHGGEQAGEETTQA